MKNILRWTLATSAIIFFVWGCSANRIIFAHQLQYETSSQVVVDEVIALLKQHEYKVMNEGNTRMVTKNVGGYIDVEYVETDWKGTGIFESNTGSEFQVKYQIWILLESTDISIMPLVRHKAGEKVVAVKSAEDNLFESISFIPEEIRSLVNAKKL